MSARRADLRNRLVEWTLGAARTCRRVVRAVGLVAAAAAPLCLVASAQAAFPGDRGRIAFSRDGDLYSMLPDGTDLRAITTTPDDDHWPRWSPDGAHLAFVRNGNLYLLRRVEGTPDPLEQITTHGQVLGAPTWHPDGTRLAYARAGQGIWSVSLGSMDGSLLLSGPYVSPAWSPQGDWLAFSDGDSLYRSNLQASPVRLTFDAVSEDDQPAWCPDGKRIVFRSLLPITGETGIGFVLPFSPGSGGGYTGGGIFYGTDAEPACRPDATADALLGSLPEVAITRRNAAGDTVIAVGPLQHGANGEDPWFRVLTAGAGTRDAEPDWQPKLAWDVGVLETDGPTVAAVRVTLPTSLPRPFTLTWSLSPGTATAWDDYQDLFGSLLVEAPATEIVIPVDVVGDADPEVDEWFFVDVAFPGFDARARVTIVDDDPVSQGPIAADVFAGRIALYSGPDGFAGSLAMLEGVGHDAEQPALSPDGSKVAYRSPQSGAFEIWTADTLNAGGTASQLTFFGSEASRPAWSPDGTRIAFVVDGSIWLMNADGTDQRPLVEGDNPAWSPDASRIAFNRGVGSLDCGFGGCPSSLHVIDVDGANEQKLVGYPGNPGEPLVHQALPAWDPDWSPDGRYLLYTGQHLVSFEAGYSAPGIMLLDLGRPLEPGPPLGSGPANPRPLVDPLPGATACQTPDWSPDGQRIVYSCRAPGGSDPLAPADVLWTANADGSSPASTGLAGTSPDWGPWPADLEPAVMLGPPFEVQVREADADVPFVIPVPMLFFGSAAPREVSVSWQALGEPFAGVPAEAGIDWSETSGNLTFRAGERSLRLPLVIRGDDEPEPVETFRVCFSVEPGNLCRSSTLVKILDDDSGNQPPVAVSDVVATALDTPVAVAVLANDSDPDGDPLSLEAVSAPQRGTATIAGDIIGYAPAPGFVGVDHFLYTITDAAGLTTRGAVSVYVGEDEPLPPPPLLTVTPAFLDFGLVPENKTRDLLLTVTNGRPQPVALSEYAFVHQGDPRPFDVFDIANGESCRMPWNRILQPGQSCTQGVRFWAVPGAEAAGPARIRFLHGQSFETLAVVPLIASVGPPGIGPNRQPVAIDDLAGVAPGLAHTLYPLWNDTDPDDDVLRILSVADPAHGSAAVVSCDVFPQNPNADCVRYESDPGYTGLDAIVYTVSDGRGGAASATYHLAVGSVVPVITAVTPDSGPTSGGQAVRITGSSFLYRSSVMFVCPAGLLPVPVAQLTDTEIRLTTLPAPAGDCSVRVTTPFGQSAELANAYRYRGIELTLAPATAANAVGSSHTVQALVTDGSDESARVAISGLAEGAVRVELLDPGAPDSPLAVAVATDELGGSDIVVSLATSAEGSLASTAAQVVAALNANPASAAVVAARTWPGATGSGIVQPRPSVALSRVTFGVTGAHALSAACVTSVPGICSVAYVGHAPGTDQIDAYLDVNGNGSPEADEPSASAETTWTADEPASADLALAASAAPDPVDAGSVLTYTATVTNAGPGTARGVRVSLPVDASLAFQGSSPPAACTGPASGAAGVIVCELGDLPAGSGSTVTVETRPAAAGPLATTLNASANQVDPNPADNSVTVALVVRLDPVVIVVHEGILVTDAPAPAPSVVANVSEPVVVGDALAVTPSVLLSIAEEIVVSDALEIAPIPASALVVSPVSAVDFPGLPTDVTLTAMLTSQGAPVAGQPVTFSLNDRPVGSATTGSDGVAALAEVSVGGIAVGVYPNGVRASFAGTSTLGPSSATASLTVEAHEPADVAVSVTPPSTVAFGSNLTYTVTLSNLGPSSANVLRLNVTLPAGLQLVGDSAGGACTWIPGLGTCDFDSVAPGGSRAIAIVARLGTTGPATAGFVVSAPQHDPNQANNSAAVTVDAPPTVAIDQAPGQADPTNASPIQFVVAFSEPVTGFTGSDVSFSGSLAGGTLAATVTGSGTSYTVSVTGMSGAGLVAASIPAGAAVDGGGNPSRASTSTDGTVLFGVRAAYGVVSPGNGGLAVLAFLDLGGQLSGLLSYSRGSTWFTATRITSFVISGQTATIEGFSSSSRLFVATVHDGGSGQPDRFRLWIEGVEQTAGGALASGTVVVEPWEADARLKGWVDLHTHPMSNLAFGGKLFHGAPSVGSLMPAVQMPDDPECRFDQRATSIAEALSQDGPTRGDPLQSRCGDLGRNAVIKAIEAFNGAATAPAGSGGFPAFTHWPRWDDITHQKMWVEWIRRSWQYGQRVMVALSHNNRTLADLLGSGGPVSGVRNDEASSALQIDEIKRLVSDHPDFMAVATTPAELHGIVQGGRLAVVLGAEIDKIGDFGVGPGVTQGMIDVAIDGLVAQGVRYILPIHLADNAFGDMAIYDDMYNLVNFRENGAFWRVGCAPSAAEVGFRSLGIPPGLTPLVPPGMPAPPASPGCQVGQQFTGHVNARTANGLTALGDYAVRAMMRRGIIVDIDHMSDRAANRTLALAAAVPGGGYPLMSGHSGVRSRSSTSHSAENSRTTAQLARIACLGGMFGLGTGDKSGTRAVDWTAQYARAYDVMRRAFAPNGLCPQGTPLGTGFLGLGTDTNSLVKTPPPTLLDPGGSPRFTDIYNSSNPANAGVPPLVRSTTGTRTWDYNLDGVAHYGMFVDFLRDVRTLPASTTITGRQIVDDQMTYASDYFHRMWLKAEAQKTRVP